MNLRVYHYFSCSAQRGKMLRLPFNLFQGVIIALKSYIDMISLEFINECCDKVYSEPIAIKLQIPFWVTATKGVPVEYLRKMIFQDPGWLFLILPKKTNVKELREVLSALSPFCIDYYYLI